MLSVEMIEWGQKGRMWPVWKQSGWMQGEASNILKEWLPQKLSLQNATSGSEVISTPNWELSREHSPAESPMVQNHCYLLWSLMYSEVRFLFLMSFSTLPYCHYRGDPEVHHDSHQLHLFPPCSFCPTGHPCLSLSCLAVNTGLMYITAVLGNSILIAVIITERNLHEPMYFFLCMLAITDILLSTTTVPKALAIFWLHAHDTAFDACVTQVFFVHVMFVGSQPSISHGLWPVRAICESLHYKTMCTWPVVGRIAVAIVTRSFCIIFPVIFLLVSTAFLPDQYHPALTVSILKRPLGLCWHHH